MSSPEILLNLDNLFSNASYFLQKSSKLFAVVKANAYGHGALEITKALEGRFNNHEIPYFCLARLSEVEALRAQGISRSCLVLSEWECSNMKLWPADCTPVIHSFEDVQRLPKATTGFQKVHIKINTGMNRLGWDHSNLEALEQGIDNLAHKGFVIEGMMSHLVRAEDDPSIFSNLQQERFLKTLKAVLSLWKPQWGAQPKWIHLANSEGFFHGVGNAGPFNSSRIGLGLWGVQENDQVSKRNDNLRPVLSLRAPARKIFNVANGEGVGYGHAYRTSSNRRLATVNLGYADGLRRDLANEILSGGLYYHGKKLPFCGRISMDLCTVDVTDVECKEGDWFYWINENQSVESLASSMKTISYEIFCSLGSRFKRTCVGATS